MSRHLLIFVAFVFFAACNSGRIPNLVTPTSTTTGGSTSGTSTGTSTGTSSGSSTGTSTGGSIAPLQVDSTVPTAAEDNVQVGVTLSANFDRALDPAISRSGCQAPFVLSTDNFTTCVSATVSVSGDTLSLSPSAPLDYATTYSARISDSLLASDGGVLAAPITWSFTTTSIPDTTPPTGTISPATLLTIPQTQPIVLHFSESINRSSLAVGGTIGAANPNVAWSKTTFTDDTLTLTGALPLGASETVTVDYKDLAGNAGTQIRATYDIEPTPTVVSVLPASSSVIGGPTPIVIVFSISMDTASLQLTGTLAANANPAWSQTSVANDTLTLTGPWPDTGGTGESLIVNATADTIPLATKTLTYTVNATAPTVVSEAPAANSTIGIQNPISILFSETTNAGSVTLTGTFGSLAVTSWTTTTNTNDTLVITPPIGGWPTEIGHIGLPTTITDSLGNPIATGQDFLYDAEAVTIAYTGNQGVDWASAITVSSNIPLTTTALSVTGTMVATDSAQVSALNLILTPTAHWNSGAGEVMQVIAEDAYGDTSNTLLLTFNVFDGAVYVATSGDDTQPGTHDEPVADIATGVSVAQTVYPTSGEIHVGMGTYTENPSVTAGLSLIGGYDATWDSPPERSNTTTLVGTVTLSSASLHHFTLQAATATNTTAITVSGAGTADIDDNAVSVFAPSGNAVGIHASGASAVVTIEHNSISATAAGTITGVDTNVQTGQVTDNFITSSGGTSAIGITAVNGGTLTIQQNRVTGGSASGATTAIVLTANPFGEIVIEKNAINGGTGAPSAGINLTADVPVRIDNNLITAGGSSGAAHAVVAFGHTRLLNNTIHEGSGTQGECVLMNAAGATIENNICFLDGYGGAGPHAAFSDDGVAGGADPVSLENNLIIDFGGTGTPFAYIHNNSSGTGSCTFDTNFDCWTFDDSPFPLNQSADTGATNSSGNIGLDGTVPKVFMSIDGPDGVLETLFDASGVLEDDWTLAGAGIVGTEGNPAPIDTAGLDGAASFGFTDDYNGTVRMGDGSTGWSIGAYEL